MLVVQIHNQSPVREALLPVCQMAVPVFFMISGYFILNADGRLEQRRLAKSFLKVLRLTVWAQVLYILYTIGCAMAHPERYEGLFQSPDTWISLLLVGSTFNGALWYLVSYLQCLLLLMAVNRVGLGRYLWIFIPLGLLTNLLLGEYAFLWSDTGFSLEIHRNALTVGMPCIVIGMLVRRYERLITADARLWLPAFATVLLLYAEEFALRGWNHDLPGGDIALFTIPLAAVVFIWFLKMEVPVWMRWSVGWGKKHSLNIYVLHGLIGSVIGLRLGAAQPARVLVVIALALLASMTICHMRKSTLLPSRAKAILLP